MKGLVVEIKTNSVVSAEALLRQIFDVADRGDDFKVIASVGHIKDLPKKGLRANDGISFDFDDEALHRQILDYDYSSDYFKVISYVIIKCCILQQSIHDYV